MATTKRSKRYKSAAKLTVAGKLHTIEEAMEAVMEGRTTVVIAHRLSTIRGADLIVFLRNGQVVEAGTHAELLARGGEYARFHPMQFGDAEGA